MGVAPKVGLRSTPAARLEGRWLHASFGEVLRRFEAVASQSLLLRGGNLGVGVAPEVGLQLAPRVGDYTCCYFGCQNHMRSVWERLDASSNGSSHVL